jgi:hypothetical protein
VKTSAALTPPFEKRNIPTKPSLSPEALAHSPSANGDIVPLPTSENASSIPLTALESLPTIFGRNNHVALVDTDIGSFLIEDLNLERLNRIHNQLWMAGRPLRGRPLHRYKMESFQILHTQKMDLHLLKFSNRLIVKPLPEYLLDYEFWRTHLCNDVELHKSACGFLLSYLWLIVSPLDLKLAQDLFLVPTFITWPWWKDFVSSFYSYIDVNALDQVNKRYHFGDLRLGRINSIYRTRFFYSHFVRGYLYGYNRYVVFFERNFSWILIVFVFFSLVLSAMQVGVSISPLQENRAFLDVSYGFVVFSMVSVGAILVVVGSIFATVFFVNMGLAISHDNNTRRKRARMAKERIEGKKDA